MKRRIFVIVLLCILCGVSANQNIPEYAKTGVRISELSTQEQILFLSEHLFQQKISESPNLNFCYHRPFLSVY